MTMRFARNGCVAVFAFVLIAAIGYQTIRGAGPTRIQHPTVEAASVSPAIVRTLSALQNGGIE